MTPFFSGSISKINTYIYIFIRLNKTVPELANPLPRDPKLNIGETSIKISRVPMQTQGRTESGVDVTSVSENKTAV